MATAQNPASGLPRRFFLLLTSLLALFVSSVALPGCGDSGGDDGKPVVRILVVPKGTTHEFWKMIEAGVRKAEAEINEKGDIRLEAIWKGPLKEDDTQDQVELVKTFLNRNVKGMVIAPLDKTALALSVAEWKEANRPVIVIDSGLDGKAGVDFASYVATNNYHGGELAADRLGEVLGGKGKAILLRYMVGSESTEQREKGFTDRLKSKFPDIELISDNQYAGATEREAFEKSQNLLTRFTSEAQAIFCPNESSVAGMLSALEQADLAGEIKLIGFDASEKLVTGLEKGHIQGLVLQNPIKMGYLGVKSLVSVINGEKLPEYVDTGVVVATPENMKEPAMVDLHSPDLSKWLK